MVMPSRSVLPGQDNQYGNSRSALLPQVFSRQSALGHMVLLSAAQTANQLSTFGATVLVARVLGPTDFGWFSVALTTVTLLSQLPGAGLDLGAMRLSALHYNLDVGKSRAVLGLAGLIKVVSALAICMLVLLASLSTANLGERNWSWALAAGAIGALASAGGSWIVSTLQSQECHGQAAVVLFISSVFKVAPIVALSHFSLLTFHTATAGYVFGLLVVATGMFAPGVRQVLSTHMWDRDVFTCIVDYSKWSITANVFGILLISSDLYFLSLLRPPAEVGIYSAARTLATGIAVLSNSALVVLLPKAGRIQNRDELVRFIVRSEVYMAIMIVPVAAVFVLTPFVLELFYGSLYGNAVSILRMLLVAYGLALPSTPIIVYLLVRNRPDVIAWVNFVGLAVAVVGYVVIVPPHGAVGAALVYLASRLLIALLSSFLSFRVPGKALHPLKEDQTGM